MNHEKAICIKKNKWTERKLIQNPFLVSDKRNWSKHVYSSDIVGMSGLRPTPTTLKFGHDLSLFNFSEINHKKYIYSVNRKRSNLKWKIRLLVGIPFIWGSMSYGSRCKIPYLERNHKILKI